MKSDIQYEIDDLNMPELESERTGTDDILYHVLGASKSSATVLEAILRLLSDVQGRLRAVEVKVTTVEEDPIA